MGLKWSVHRVVCDGATLLTWAEFPRERTLRAKLWNLWKADKADLKERGFRVSKYANSWRVSYFTNVTEDCFDIIGDEPNYMIRFKELYSDMHDRYEDVNSSMMSSSCSADASAEHEDDIIDDDDIPWFVEFFVLELRFKYPYS